MWPSIAQAVPILNQAFRQAPYQSTYAQLGLPRRDYTVRVSRASSCEAGSVANDCRRRPRRNSDEEERMKKIGFLTLLITATLLLTLSFSVAAAGPKAPAAPVPVAAAVPAPAAPAAMPPHPHIDEALEAMRSAKHHLESAEHEFHGHRRKAIEHLDRAIHEAEICMSEP
jgi:hypothetical protein